MTVLFRQTWIDNVGRELAPTMELDSAVGAVSLTAALADLSNAHPLNGWITTSVVAHGALPDASAGLDTIALLIYGSNTTRQQIGVLVPAPKATMFLADGETVNSAAIATLTAEVTAHCLMADGTPATRFVRGTKRQLSRQNSW